VESKSNLGQSAYSSGTLQAGHSRIGFDHSEVPAKAQTLLADMANVPPEPHEGPGRHRLLYGSNGLLWGLFVFLVLAHHRRKVLHFNVIDSPSASWTAQQLVEAFPYCSPPRYLVRDRDSIYGHAFTNGSISEQAQF
jgi:hypothetical protein